MNEALECASFLCIIFKLRFIAKHMEYIPLANE